MAEENKIKESEGEILSWDEQKTTYTVEEVNDIKKKMQSDSEKGVQKLISNTKAYESAMWYIPTLVEDKAKLVEIYEEKPEVAKIILDKVYGGQSIESFKEAIWYEEDITDPKVIERRVAQLAKQQADEMKVESTKSEFINKFKLEWDELKAFEEAFTERMELKSFSISTLDTHLEKALKEVIDESPSDRIKTIKAMAQTMSTGNNNNPEPARKENTSQKQAQDFLKKFGVI